MNDLPNLLQTKLPNFRALSVNGITVGTIIALTAVRLTCARV